MLTTYPPDVKEFVEAELAGGEFRDEKELVVHALAVLREVKARHATLRGQIQASLDEANRGQLAPLDFATLRQKAMERLNPQG